MTGTPESADDLRALYEAVRRLTSGPPRPDELIELLTLHPESCKRREWTCGVVMREWAGRKELAADVMQEATYLLIERIRSGRLQFEDRGLGRFRGWLWTIWHQACGAAWRRYRAHLDEQTGAPMSLVPAKEPRVVDEEAPLVQVQQAIERIEDPSVRQVMSLWAAGLSGDQTAALLERSRSWVSKRRAEGVARVRSILRRDST